jgi:hypothetical protein
MWKESLVIPKNSMSYNNNNNNNKKRREEDNDENYMEPEEEEEYNDVPMFQGDIVHPMETIPITSSAISTTINDCSGVTNIVTENGTRISKLHTSFVIGIGNGNDNNNNENYEHESKKKTETTTATTTTTTNENISSSSLSNARTDARQSWPYERNCMISAFMYLLDGLEAKVLLRFMLISKLTHNISISPQFDMFWKRQADLFKKQYSFFKFIPASDTHIQPPSGLTQLTQLCTQLKYRDNPKFGSRLASNARSIAEQKRSGSMYGMGGGEFQFMSSSSFA